jgi:hypothetical protein
MVEGGSGSEGGSKAQNTKLKAKKKFQLPGSSSDSTGAGWSFSLGHSLEL